MRSPHQTSTALSGALLFLLLAATTPPASAIDLEKLVMPGPVIAAHEEVEAECGRCHAPFQAEAQNARCFACHEEVEVDLREHTGFHGRSSGVAAASCRDCHTEHKGRAADIVGLDRAAFDHDETDYPLVGAHRRVSCDACHLKDVPFREAASDCIDCHREDDPHEGRLGPGCADCHVERSWQEARFDHDSTAFPLAGEHRQVDCTLCHPGERYENTAKDCVSCHRVNDKHAGRFGPDCAACHSEQGWKRIRFDHDRDTKFPLRGRHRGATCEACHRQPIHSRQLSANCVSCHRGDDVHAGRNGTDCERCHSETAWNAETFDHDKMTDFPLRGAHRLASCERCHTGTLGKQKLETSCVACHRDDDVHRGQEGERCGTCHDEQAWTAEILFEHDVTRFPLLGLHATVSCEQCHATARFKDTALGCSSCHAEDDKHLRRLGPDCERCHNPNGWELWQFDHDKDTDFALHGAHQGLDCHSCHRVAVRRSIQLSASCQECHAQDDKHFGAFGRDCGRCHRDTRWEDVTLPR